MEDESFGSLTAPIDQPKFKTKEDSLNEALDYLFAISTALESMTKNLESMANDLSELAGKVEQSSKDLEEGFD